MAKTGIYWRSRQKIATGACIDVYSGIVLKLLMETGTVSETNVRGVLGRSHFISQCFLLGQSHLKSAGDSLNSVVSDLNVTFKCKRINHSALMSLRLRFKLFFSTTGYFFSFCHDIQLAVEHKRRPTQTDREYADAHFFFKLPFLIIVINSFRQPRLTLTNARTSAVEIAAAALCKAYTQLSSHEGTIEDNKSPQCSTRKKSINHSDRGLFPPMLTYFRERCGQREIFWKEEAECLLSLPSHINAFIHHYYLK